MAKDNVTKRKVEDLTTEGKPKAVAKYNLGFTINLGNYESCKIEAGLELEGTVDNLDELQERVQEEVEDEVWSEMEQLKKKDKSKTVLGDRA
jgi:hypothetical protein